VLLFVLLGRTPQRVGHHGKTSCFIDCCFSRAICVVFGEKLLTYSAYLLPVSVSVRILERQFSTVHIFISASMIRLPSTKKLLICVLYAILHNVL